MAKAWGLTIDGVIQDTVDRNPEEIFHSDVAKMFEVVPEGAVIGDAVADGKLYRRPPYGLSFDAANKRWIVDEERAKADEDAWKAREQLPSAVAVAKLLVQTAAPAMTDTTALAVAVELPDAFRSWVAGEKYAAAEVIAHNGKIYRVIQAVTAQAHQPPDAAGMLAVYRPLVLSASGTASDPIPFENGMDAETGKYYSFGGKLYLCKTDMKPCVWNPGTAGLWQWEYVRDL